MDKLSKLRRSENMARIRSKDTSPEILVRRLVSKLGFRYRLHVRELPGKPDLVFRPLKKIIFVHGCFWHLHSNCREGRIPLSRQEYWGPKLSGNVQRDHENLKRLKADKWQVLIVWECEQNESKLEKRIARFLDKPSA